MEKLEVGTPETGATFDATDGGRLVSLRFRGTELLRTTDSRGGVWFGGFVLIPWSGILPGAKLEVQGVTYQFPQNWEDGRLHGLLNEVEWAVAGDALTAQFPETWPFGGSARMHPFMDGNTLVVEFAVTAARRAMPIAIGWHPWFTRRLDNGAELAITLPSDARMWEEASTGHPDGQWITPGPGPYNNCFSTDESVVLDWASTKETLRLTVSSNGGFVSVYSPEESGVAIEPMTSIPGTLPGWLEPGETKSLTVRLEGKVL